MKKEIKIFLAIFVILLIAVVSGVIVRNKYQQADDLCTQQLQNKALEEISRIGSQNNLINMLQNGAGDYFKDIAALNANLKLFYRDCMKKEGIPGMFIKDKEPAKK
ncbi:MAG: hypothetical protein M1142_04860 [Patescibacteria group bacterium]|nr:hypothetical protein [Patescibacteria group bacterium]